MKFYSCVFTLLLYQALDIINAKKSGETLEHNIKTFPLNQIQPILKPASVVYPGGKEECENDATCCNSKFGVHGCCPYRNAVCCFDEKHCCPKDFTCHISQRKCIKKYRSKKLQSMIFSEMVNIIGKERDTACLKGTTRGQSKMCSSSCPYRKAVCCSGEKQCCPHGYTCDISNAICIRSSKLMAFHGIAVPRLTSVECPCGKEKCPHGTTCCKSSTGKHGCCPHLNVVCCVDGMHCCPHGYSCNSSIETCVKQNETAKFYNMTESIQILKNVVCPGGEEECLDGNTCCKSASGGYGCCPEPNAVCCSNGENCCPHGYFCDLDKGLCDKRFPLYNLKNKIWGMKEDAIIN